MIDQPYRDRNSDRRVIPWLLLGLLVLFGGVYVAGYLATSDRVPRGTTVSGVAIGGLTPASAEVRLASEIDAQRRAPVVVSALGQRGRIDPTTAGLDVDIEASVAQAGGGRSWDPARIWDSLTDGDDFDAVTTVDEDALGKAVQDFAREVDTPARDGAVVFKDETAVPRAPRDGQVVDQAAAVAAIGGGLPRRGRPGRAGHERRRAGDHQERPERRDGRVRQPGRVGAGGHRDRRRARRAPAGGLRAGAVDGQPGRPAGAGAGRQAADRGGRAADEDVRAGAPSTRR